MKNKKIDIDSLLYTIERNDIELLRINKNKNRDFFFLKDEISTDQQERWFDSYSQREDDFMFVCKESEITFGCMGFRLFEEKIDAYNIMRFCPSQITMETCMKKMMEFAAQIFPSKQIQVRVLKHNPAISWYEKIGFEKVSDETNFVTLYYKKS